MPNNSEVLLHDIRTRMNYEEFFREFLPDMRRAGREFRARCLWHEDHDPSLSINTDDGVYLCRVPSCGARGDFISFYRRRVSATFPEALEYFARRVGLNTEDFRSTSTLARMHRERVEAMDEDALIANYRAPIAAPTGEEPPPNAIDEQIVTSAHEQLLALPERLAFLSARRGLTRETIERFQIGHDGQRFYIPIRDASGQVVNIRRYKPGASGADKMLSWRQGYGSARLWPLESLNREDLSIEDAPTVFLFEGEMDCMLAAQNGLAAVTTTGGAGTWRETWNTLFERRDVVICYDADDAGRAGSLNVARSLHGTAASIRIVRIPLSEPIGADFTDFLVDHGHAISDFTRLVTDAPFFRLDDAHAAPAVPEEAIDVHLSAASRAEFYNRPIRFAVMVSGKTTAPYIVPREVQITCTVTDGMEPCTRCPTRRTNGQATVELDYATNEILQFINVPENQLQRQLKSKLNVPQKCPLASLEITATANIEELQVIPEIDRTDQETPYVTRAVYFRGHGLQTNRSYMMTGITVPEPKKQLATHLIFDAIPAQSNIDAFSLTDEVKENLRKFQPRGRALTDLWAQTDLIQGDLERKTRIYQRRDLMLAVDLTFHSPLTFSFQGEMLQRGWGECLIIGDSRTGKTTIVQRLVEHYAAGEFSSGENTTLAGLVGGLHQIGTSWALQWGKIPLNDRRLIVIDEAGNLPQDHIARMSSMRSSGIAEIVKVHTERTNARTRQIWISNPRSPRPLSTFSQGVLAVKELIGAPEDIARFDLIVTAASSDVELSVVNAAREQQEPEIFTSQLCHQRVMWAWSRKPSDVVYTAEAVTRTLEVATEQGRKYRYATEIPLVEPNEQRIKLARLAVSAATLFYSTDDEGEKIVVHPEHVDFVAALLEQLYAKPSLAFDEYARMQNVRYDIDADVAAEVVNRSPTAARALLEQEHLTQRDLQEILACNDRDDLRECVTKLRESGFLKRVGSSYYVKTSGAISWLRNQVTRNDPLRSGAVSSFVETMAIVAPVDPDTPVW